MPEIHYKFLDAIPSTINQEPILISGDESAALPDVEYLLINENRALRGLYQIRFKGWVGPFKQALIVDNLLAVGISNFFFLYDLLAQESILALELDGYFSHIYVNNGLFYIAGSGSIFCLDSKGKFIWVNDNVGIDGVLIREFTSTHIYGSGEWDPPNGWRNFALDLNTGKSLDSEAPKTLNS